MVTHVTIQTETEHGSGWDFGASEQSIFSWHEHQSGGGFRIITEHNAIDRNPPKPETGKLKI